MISSSLDTGGGGVGNGPSGTGTSIGTALEYLCSTCRTLTALELMVDAEEARFEEVKEPLELALLWRECDPDCERGAALRLGNSGAVAAPQRVGLSGSKKLICLLDPVDEIDDD